MNAKHKCDLCEKSFVEQRSLKGHRDHVHFGKSFECEICQTKFPSKRNLEGHKKSVHERKENQKLYSCDFSNDLQ